MYKQLFYKLYLSPFKAFIEADRNHAYHGCKLGSEMDPEFLNRLHEYRMDFYHEHLPYLLPKTEIELQTEKQKDLRSYHIWVEDKAGMIVGSCMLSPYPFEISPFVGPEVNEKFRNYLEISRLLVKKQGQGIGMRLLFRPNTFCIPHKTYKGILGICKPVRMSMFRLVGMKRVGRIQIKERENKVYDVIANSNAKLSVIMNFLAIKNLIRAHVTHKIVIPNAQTLKLFLFVITLFAFGNASSSAIKKNELHILNADNNVHKMLME